MNVLQWTLPYSELIVEIELVPCPFCGEADDLKATRVDDRRTSIECLKCGAIGPCVMGDADDEIEHIAAKEWNERTTGGER